MASPTVWTIYDQFKLKLGEKLIDLTADSIKMALFSSTSNCGSHTLGTATYAALTNELAAASGYSTGGVSCAATWANSSGTETFDIADATWNATGGTLTARFAVIYDSTTGDLICYSILDSTPADVSALSGTALTVQISSSGVFTLA